LFILLVQVIGIFSGLLIRKGIKIYSSTIIKQPLSLPNIVFSIISTVLFTLMGAGIVRIYMAPKSENRLKSMTVLFVQLIFNFFWSLIFLILDHFLFLYVCY